MLEGASLSQYEGCGHFPHREAPGRFTEEVERFLDQDSVPAPRLKRPLSVQVDLESPASVLARAWGSLTRALRWVFGIAHTRPADPSSLPEASANAA